MYYTVVHVSKPARNKTGMISDEKSYTCKTFIKKDMDYGIFYCTSILLVFRLSHNYATLTLNTIDVNNDIYINSFQKLC